MYNLWIILKQKGKKLPSSCVTHISLQQQSQHPNCQWLRHWFLPGRKKYLLTNWWLLHWEAAYDKDTVVNSFPLIWLFSYAVPFSTDNSHLWGCCPKWLLQPKRKELLPSESATPMINIFLLAQWNSSFLWLSAFSPKSTIYLFWFFNIYFRADLFT